MPLESVDPVVTALVQWGEEEPNVRALILTSSRARDDGSADELSDYDMVVVARDAGSLAADADWPSAYAPILAHWSDDAVLLGIERFFTGVTYQDGVSVDFMMFTGVDCSDCCHLRRGLNWHRPMSA